MTKPTLRFAAESSPILTVRIKGNVRVCVPNDLTMMTTYILLEQEDWFENEIGFVRTMLQREDRIIDVGANYGVYTLTAASIVGPGGKVWAFEPCTETSEFLRQSVHANGFGNIDIVNAALSDRHGRSYLSLSPNSELNAVTDVCDPAGQYEEIETDTLDRCMSQFGWSDIAFLKIDAEGKEESILRGARAFLATNSPLIMYEIKAEEKKINHGLVTAFQSIGYDSYRLVPELNALVPCDGTQGFDPYQLNLFACKRDRAQALSDRGLLLMSRELVQVPQDVFLNHAWIGPQELQEKFRSLWATALPRMRATASGAKYLQALDCYAAVQDQARPLPEHAGCLEKSFDLLTDVVRQPDSNFCRLLSFAHVAAGWGYRQFAVKAYKRLLDFVQRLGQVDMHEPLLLPATLDLNKANRNDFNKWLIACITQEFERRSAYSSYFTECSRYRLVEDFRALGYPSAEMERRRQLIRMKCGLSRSVEPDPVLAVESDQNLNSHLWTAAGQH